MIWLKLWQHLKANLTETDFCKLLVPGLGFVRVMVLCSIILLLLYSLAFHHFIITLVILLQVLALLAGTL